MPRTKRSSAGGSAPDAEAEVTLEELEELSKLHQLTGDVDTGANMSIKYNLEYLKHVNEKYGRTDSGGGGGGAEDEARPQVKTVVKLHTTPLDFSFLKISSLEQVANTVPRAGPRPVLQRLAREKTQATAAVQAAALAAEQHEAGPPKKPQPPGQPAASTQQGEGEGKDQATATATEGADDSHEPSATPRGPTRVELAGSSSLRLSNNELCSLEALPECLGPVLLLPHKLQWLDLSFNQISHIEPIASACPSLRLLYLHVNAVTEPRQLDALSQLAHLHTLTLHGNEVENAPNYRFRLASNLPTLKNLDFSALTIVEKDKARTWAAGQQARRRAQGRTM